MTIKGELSRRVVFIGQAPARSDHKAKFGSSSGRAQKRLGALCGLSAEEFRSGVGWVNLLSRWPGKNGKGDAFDFVKARHQAWKLNLLFKDGQRVVFLGRNVCRTFNAETLEPLSSVLSITGTRFWHVPHPSGVNRWWNDPAHRRSAAAVLRTILSCKSSP